ncbi:flightin-like [Penaeus japonicus]|uniref:flightin-like n=1 Tax=Penaeus japonicus TaxID=27405 RepID=UPI001C71397E|nr:flightin-like [Penaeus japonicus]
MAGDEDKKKKKKSKKTEKAEKVEEAPPPPEPEPEPQPEPAPPAADEETSASTEEAPPAAPEGEAPAEAPADAPVEGEAPPPPPKKKPKFFVHWNRRKPRFYDYNWDYGDNYYSSMVKYMDTRSGDRPRRMAFAERGIRSNVIRKTIPDSRTASLLDDVRKSIKNFEISQKAYMKSY